MDKILFDRIEWPEKGERPDLLGKPVPTYTQRESMYPEQLRALFSDGHTAVYDLRVEQPAPVIMENIRIIRKWKTGYVNQPARRRGKK